MSKAIVLITRRATFSAAHRLYDPAMNDETNVRLFGTCANPHGHGHNYILQVTLRGSVDSSGMLINLAELKSEIEKQVLAHVDHKNLNEDVPFLSAVNPTVENLVVAFWDQLATVFRVGQLYEVTLIETENNWASYHGETLE